MKAKQRAVSESQFPETADLPDEFDDLYYEWIDMRKFVTDLVVKTLEGERVSFTDLGAFDVERVRRRVRELQTAHPDVGPPYAALFAGCEELLDLVRRASSSP
jgi:hypothetical protein